MGRKCVFCGVGKATREDVFEQELNKVLGITGPVTSAMGDPAVPWRPPHPTLDVVVRATCKGCNNVWLNGIWGRFRDLMRAAMLNTSTVTLPIQGQMDVSMWAVKTALLLELATRATRGHAWLPMNHFPHLRREGQPPPGTDVWVFRVNAENKMPAWHQAGVLLGEGGSPNGYAATITIGYLGMQVLGRKIAETREGGIIFNQDAIEPPPAFNGILQQILPISGPSVTWPPRLTVRADQLSIVAAWPGINTS